MWVPAFKHFCFWLAPDSALIIRFWTGLHFTKSPGSPWQFVSLGSITIKSVASSVNKDMWSGPIASVWLLYINSINKHTKKFNKRDLSLLMLTYNCTGQNMVNVNYRRVNVCRILTLNNVFCYSRTNIFLLQLWEVLLLDQKNKKKKKKEKHSFNSF